jgi:hypothetical protein
MNFKVTRPFFDLPYFDLVRNEVDLQPLFATFFVKLSAFFFGYWQASVFNLKTTLYLVA